MNMKRFMNKKVVAIGLAAGLTLGAAGAAFAYFTTTGGTGTGDASVGSAGAVNVSVVANTAATLVPASSPTDSNAVSETVDYTITNPGESSNYVTTATIDIASSWQGGSATPAYCVADDFSLNQQAVADTPSGATTPVTESPAADLAPNSDGTTAPTAPWTSASTVGDTYYGVFTIELVDNHANQDSCESLTTVPVTVTAS
jgi:hypothetical protein